MTSSSSIIIFHYFRLLSSLLGPNSLPVRLIGSYRCWFVYMREKYCWLIYMNNAHVRGRRTLRQSNAETHLSRDRTILKNSIQTHTRSNVHKTTLTLAHIDPQNITPTTSTLVATMHSNTYTWFALGSNECPSAHGSRHPIQHRGVKRSRHLIRPAATAPCGKERNLAP